MEKKQKKKELERPFIYNAGSDVKTISIISDSLIFYGCGNGYGYICDIHKKGHLEAISLQEVGIIMSHVLKHSTVPHTFLLFIQDRKGLVYIKQYTLSSELNSILKSEIIGKVNTEVWSFTRMAISGKEYKTLDDIEIALSTLTSCVQIYSIKGVVSSSLAIEDPSKKGVSVIGLASALFFFDSKYLAAGYESACFAIWNVKDKKVVSKINLGKEGTNILSIAAIKKEARYTLFVGAYSHTLHILEYNEASSSLEITGKIENVCCAEKPGISDIKIREDNKILFTASYDFRGRCYSSKTLKLLALLKYHTKNINVIQLKGNRVYLGSDDGFITEWEVY